MSAGMGSVQFPKAAMTQSKTALLSPAKIWNGRGPRLDATARQVRAKSSRHRIQIRLSGVPVGLHEPRQAVLHGFSVLGEVEEGKEP